ncbi:3-dehydroquinate synthase [Candidatus Terasakiella magnetica]|uniref:3-dehydroquinate synthase n=1 Tax=Candidatus Terasakiella magnetica TaxID=1867952 RepID=A0A1C3RL03_9PROT|nr:3-dehydroquinate synthase [Candidatus Terasakiella magnetica]SCA57933.1 3-dehydroquinate synthase [Candidatus Terasakiella magnetica]
MTTQQNTLHVDLDERSYDIVCGPNVLEKAGELFAPLLKSKRVVIVSDSNVAPLYLDKLCGFLEDAGLSCESVVLPAGEATKSISNFEKLLEDILAMGIERGTSLVALGGGVIGDITGFAASALLRGIDFIQVPTTLLSQVDSSVGGKTGINAKAGKNLIGAFHQPRLVLIDTQSLNSLPKRELLAGYAEVVKYGLLGDAEFFAWLEENGQALIDGDQELRREAILKSCAAKANVVAQDEKEGGVRALLNLGHTFGHALEKECGYGGDLLHGEAVSIGMVMAFEFCAQQGLCAPEDGERLKKHLVSLGMPVDLSSLPCQDWTAELLMKHMMKDKKVKDGKVTFVLVRAIGEAYLSREVEDADLKTYLDDLLKRSKA